MKHKQVEGVSGAKIHTCDIIDVDAFGSIVVVYERIVMIRLIPSNIVDLSNHGCSIEIHGRHGGRQVSASEDSLSPQAPLSLPAGA